MAMAGVGSPLNPDTTVSSTLNRANRQAAPRVTTKPVANKMIGMENVSYWT